jgi:aryl-phospho-beta-D-glucosidase BglC (GH1 family)
MTKQDRAHKRKKIQHAAEVHLWAIAKDLMGLLKEPAYTEEFKEQEIGKAIRAAYVEGRNTQSKVSHEYTMESFDSQLSSMRERMNP